MSTYRLKKVVAVCFLEATKSALDHLGQYRIELSNQRMDPPQDLTACYGDVRRMRDYLQRCVGAFNDVVDLQLEKEDRALLVACASRAVEVLDLRLENGEPIAEEEREWLVRKRQVLSNWAVEFAEEPLLALPLPRLNPTPTPGVKMLSSRIYTKITGTGAGDVDIAAAAPGEMEDRTRTRAPVPVSGGKPAAVPPTGASGRDPADPAPEAASARGALIDPRQIQDPRLRTLLSLDLRAYERARAAADHRLAMVHLSSILEGAVLDHALQRRAELGLSGSPDGWNLQEILLRALGENAPKERSSAHQVFAARDLVRPTVQLLSPTVVTPASLARLTEFVRVCLRHLGFTGAGRQGGPAVPRSARPG